MITKWLNASGLTLGMIGVTMLFFWGPPQPNLETGVGVAISDNTPIAQGGTAAEHDARVEKLRHRYEHLSEEGLALVFIGFFLQLVAVWAPNKVAAIRFGRRKLPTERTVLGMPKSCNARLNFYSDTSTTI